MLQLYQLPCCIGTSLLELPESMVRLVVEFPRLMVLGDVNLLFLELGV